MSNVGEIELTFGQFLDQKWFKRLTRIAVVLLSLFAGSTLTYFLTLGNRVTAIEQDRATRIKLTDDRLTAINQNLGGLHSEVAQVKVDVGVVKGILLDMQRREDVAALSRRLGFSSVADPALP